MPVTSGNHPVPPYRIEYRPASQAIEAEEDGRKDTADIGGDGRDERAVGAKWQCGPLPSEIKQERWCRTRPDPFDGVWEEEIEPLLGDSVEGKVSAARESQQRQIESLGRRTKRAGQQIVEAGKRGDLNLVHNKKRRLATLCQRLASLRDDVAAARVRVCFGSRKLWRKHYALEGDGYSDHSEWKKDWRDTRSDEFVVLGSKVASCARPLCGMTGSWT